MNINDILLSQTIKRWTIVATVKDQSLAEHLFNVSMIARAICAEMQIDDTFVIKYALDHDLDEVMTGDIPSPAKSRLGIKSNVYGGKSKNKCSIVEQVIVKAADLIDANNFIKYNQVDRHGQQVAEYTRRKLNQFLEAMSQQHPEAYLATENVISMMDFGEFETEIYDV